MLYMLLTIAILFFRQLKSPGIVTMINGKNKTLYISTVKSIAEATKPNLKKTLRGKVSILLQSQQLTNELANLNLSENYFSFQIVVNTTIHTRLWI